MVAVAWRFIAEPGGAPDALHPLPERDGLRVHLHIAPAAALRMWKARGAPLRLEGADEAQRHLRCPPLRDVHELAGTG